MCIVDAIDFVGAGTDRKSAIEIVEQALLQDGDWGAYGDFAKPLAALLPDYTMRIEETKDGFGVLMLGPESNQRYEISFFVRKQDGRINRNEVVIGYEAPTPPGLEID